MLVVIMKHRAGMSVRWRIESRSARLLQRFTEGADPDLEPDKGFLVEYATQFPLIYAFDRW